MGYDRASFGKYLKEARIEAGLTQKEVGDLCGYVSSQFISNWERGLCLPALEKLPIITKAFKISEQEIIDRIIEITKTDLHKVFDKGSGRRRKSS